MHTITKLLGTTAVLGITMARSKNFMRSGVAAVATIVLVLAAAGLAVAAIPDGSNTFTGCYAPRDAGTPGGRGH
jgi:hypothetical protein